MLSFGYGIPCLLFQYRRRDGLGIVILQGSFSKEYQICWIASFAGLMLLNAGGLDGRLSECVISRSSQQHRCLKAHSQIEQRTLAKQYDQPDKENKNLERP